jgi:flagellar biosynthesis/type III secretory pathway chaperone
MTVTKDEEQRIKEKTVAELLARQKKELSERMAKLGRIRTPKKRKAGIKNMKAARAYRWNKILMDKRDGK